MALPVLPKRFANPQLLGQGAVGIVLKAMDRVLRIPVAIKLTQQSVAKEERFRSLFARELRLQARLVHPNIAPLLDVGISQEGQPFLVMAYANQGSFAAFRDHPPPWPELLRLTLELLSALAYVHATGVLHRDLKPENVLLHRGKDGKLHAWLADLGAANLTEDMPHEQEIGGTPMYIAPEHAAGDVGLLGKTSDLFAVAAMLKEFLTGMTPFTGNSLEELLKKKEKDPPPFLARSGYAIPSGLTAVINHQMAPHLLDRYDLAADFAGALIAVSKHSGIPKKRAAPQDGTLSLGFDPSQGGGVIGGRLARPTEDVPRWLKVTPRVFPVVPPSTVAPSQLAQASLNLFTYRRPSLVGRLQARQALWREAQTVISTGAPRVVLLVGPAGSGKSSLVETLASHLEQGGWMEKLELRYQTPQGPTDGLLGALIRELRPEAGSRFPVSQRALWGLARWRGHLQRREEKDAKLMARQTHPRAYSKDAKKGRSADLRWFVYESLEARSWRGGSLLILEDAQWAANGEGLAYAEGLLRSQGTLSIPALTVATLRSESLAQNATLRKRCQTLVDQGAIRIDLGPMDSADVEKVLQAHLSLDKDFAKEVATKCAGSPLFAHQLLEAWVQQRLLAQKTPLRYALKGALKIEEALPSSTEALLVARIEALIKGHRAPEKIRYALHIASLAGQEGPIKLLEATIGIPWTQALLSISNILKTEEQFFRFQHGLLREALSRQAESRPDSQSLHLALARGWLLLNKQSGKNSSLRLCDHLLKGGRPDEALSRAILSAHDAHRGGRAGELYGAATLGLEAAKAANLGEDDKRPIALRRFVALAEEQQGKLISARTGHEKLVKLAMAKGNQRLMALHLRDLGRLFLQEGRLDASSRCYHQALSHAKEQDASSTTVECLRGLGVVASRRGNQELAEELLQKSAKMAHGLRDKAGEAWALFEWAAAGISPGQDLKKEERNARQALEMAEELMEDQLIGACQEVLAEIVKLRGDLSTARIRYAGCARFFAERDQAERAAKAILNMAMIELTLGSRDRAQAYLEDAKRHLAGAPRHYLLPTAYLLEALGMAQIGEIDNAIQAFQIAQSKGLGETINYDLAPPLEQLSTYAIRHGATELAKESAILAARVWRTLGDQDEAERLEHTISTMVVR